MATFKCSGQRRVNDEGVQFCTYEAQRSWAGGPCPGCGRLYNVIRMGVTKTTEEVTAASLGAKKEKPRLSSGLSEFDAVLSTAGGFVKGSTLLISGAPGGGKTTLILETMNRIAQAGKSVLFASGEQSVDDLGDTCRRLHCLDPNLIIMGMEGDVYKIMARAEEKKVAAIAVDSLQSAFLPDTKGDAGSTDQCNAVAMELTEFGKRTGTVIVVVCQINKDGDLAGPKKAEHWVDTVLELDEAAALDEYGDVVDATVNFKKLRTGKNRHGSSNLTAVFDMTAEGMKPVRKKSLLHLV